MLKLVQGQGNIPAQKREIYTDSNLTIMFQMVNEIQNLNETIEAKLGNLKTGLHRKLDRRHF